MFKILNNIEGYHSSFNMENKGKSMEPSVEVKGRMFGSLFLV